MSKYYFSDDWDDRCYTKDTLIDLMKTEWGIKELKIYPAIMMVKGDYFYCKKFREVGEVGEGCGKECDKYEPRNGKNGRCRYSNNCYEPDYGNPEILIVD